MAAMFGDLEGLRLGHIEDLPADGGSVTVSVRQRRAAALTSARIMIDDMVGRRGPFQGGSLVARLAATGPVGLAALAPGALLPVTALLLQAVAGRRPGAGGAVERGAALEFGDPLAQAGVLLLQRVVLLDQGRAQAQQPLAPFPNGFDGGHREGLWGKKVLQAREGLVVGSEVLVPARHCHEPSSASTAMIAASTARRSPAGMAS